MDLEGARCRPIYRAISSVISPAPLLSSPCLSAPDSQTFPAQTAPLQFFILLCRAVLWLSVQCILVYSRVVHGIDMGAVQCILVY